jgi:excisionase family DNA binding protein
MQSQPAFTGWPALLTLEHACRYLSLEEAEYLLLAARWGIHPVEIDGDKLVWRLSELNSMIRQLPAAKGRLDQLRLPKTIQLDRATIELLAEAIATCLHLGGGLPVQHKPQLVAIKEAARQLGLGRTKVNQMIDEGVLRVQRIGRRKLVTQSSIQDLLDR